MMTVIVDEVTGEIKPFVEKKKKAAKVTESHNVARTELPDGRVAIDTEHGEVVVPKRSKLPRAEGAPDKLTMHMKARRFIAGYGSNLAWQGGQFMSETAGGWEVVTDELTRRAHAFIGGNARRDFLTVVQDEIKIPEVSTCTRSTLYYERVTQDNKLVWLPFHLSKTEVMLTDGIYDIQTDVLQPFAGRVIYGPRISMPWLSIDGEPSRCPEFEAMIARALPDAEIRRHFQEVMSTLLQPHSVLRGQIILWGPPGSAKTTLATAIGCSVAGATGVSFIQEAELVKSKWSAAGLLNKFANISDDSPVVRGWPGFLKSYTSGNLRLEQKFRDPYRAPATAKLISTCNELQDAADASGAMVDRMYPFRFANRVAGHWNTEVMTVEYWSVPERREGVVNWLLEGLIRMRDRGEFLVPAQWEAEKQIAVNQADPLEAWLREHLERGEGDLKREDLVAKIPADLVPSQGFDSKLASYMVRLFKINACRIREGGEKIRVYSGIRWSD